MSDRPPLGVRADLLDVAPYESPQLPARVRLNTNESPYPPPAGLLSEVERDLERSELNRYPDHSASRLLEALARHTGWDRAGLWAANGSNEVYLHLFLAYGGRGRTSLTFEPTYSLHTLIPRITGTRALAAPRDGGRKIDIGAAQEAIAREQPDIVIVCSPNNPTGGLETQETVEELLSVAPGIVVVDEAYIEFAPEAAGMRPLLGVRERLVITRTFSKAWSLAGVRLGYLMGPPAFVRELERVRLPYHLSRFTQLVGEAALRHAPETLAMVERLVADRDRLVAGMERLGVHVHPTAANFILFEVPDPQATWQALLDRGVLVRNYSSVPGLEGCLRVTAGLPEECAAFLSALEEVLGG